MKRIDYSNEDIYLYLFLKAFILELLCMLSIRNCSREKVKKKKRLFLILSNTTTNRPGARVADNNNAPSITVLPLYINTNQ